MQMKSSSANPLAMSPPRCARLFSPHSDFSQDFGARCSGCPTGACISQRKARSVWNFNSVSGRRVSFLSSYGRARARVSSMLTVEDRSRGCGGLQLLTKGHGAVDAFPSNETQRLAPGRAKSQVPRDARCWCSYQRHGGNAGTMVLTHKRAPPAGATNPNWRATDRSPSGHQPHNFVKPPLLFFNPDGVLKSCDVSEVRTISPPTARSRSAHPAGR